MSAPLRLTCIRSMLTRMTPRVGHPTDRMYCLHTTQDGSSRGQSLTRGAAITIMMRGIAWKQKPERGRHTGCSVAYCSVPYVQELLRKKLLYAGSHVG